MSSRTAIAALLLVAACQMPPEGKQAEGAGSVKAARVFMTTAANEDGQWLTPQKDYANTRFSGLSEINLSNIDKLKAVTTFSTGMLAGHEATPLVAGSTMYLVTPFPNIL